MKASLKSKLGYAAGDIYGGGAFLVFSLLYMNYLTVVEGLPVVATSVIILIGKLWDAVTDPVCGIISDKTRSKFGRRRVFFLVGAFPVFLSFVMLFYSFGIQSTAFKIAYHTFAYMFFCTAFTIVMVPYNAILSDITDDYNERTAYTTVRMAMSSGASLLCAVIPGLIIKSAGGDVNGPDQKIGYLVMALILGAVFGFSWLLTFWGTKEREDLPEPDTMTLKKWLSVFKNKPYLNFLGIFLTFQIAVDLMLALFIFYVDIVVLKYKSYELIVGTLLIFSLILLAPMGAIAKKRGKYFPLFIGLPIWIFTMLAFIPANQNTPVALLCFFAVLIAFGSSSGNLATWSMLIDIYDVDEIMTGKRREGIYSGITTFLRKSASGIAILVLGIGLKALGFDQEQYNLIKATAEDFDPSKYAQSGVVFGVKWMFVIIPIIFMSACLFFAARNKISQKRYDSIQKGITAFKDEDGLNSIAKENLEDILYVTGLSKEELWAGEK
ncbi:MAG TPA: MFS transporter [Clostridiales bacterium]|nr:MFS transporter [Clostridiales bacterium]